MLNAEMNSCLGYTMSIFSNNFFLKGSNVLTSLDKIVYWKMEG